MVGHEGKTRLNTRSGELATRLRSGNISSLADDVRHDTATTSEGGRPFNAGKTRQTTPEHKSYEYQSCGLTVVGQRSPSFGRPRDDKTAVDR